MSDLTPNTSAVGFQNNTINATGLDSFKKLSFSMLEGPGGITKDILAGPNAQPVEGISGSCVSFIAYPDETNETLRFVFNWWGQVLAFDEGAEVIVVGPDNNFIQFISKTKDSKIVRVQAKLETGV